MAAAPAARALLTREPAGTGVCPPASLASQAHPAQTCTSGGRAALGAVLPRRGSECLQAPGLTSLSRCSRPGSQHALGLGGRRGPPLATAHAPWGREGPAGAQEATEARPAPRSPQRHHVQQRGATGLPQGMQGLGARGRLPPSCRLCPLDSPGLPSPSGWGGGLWAAATAVWIGRASRTLSGPGEGWGRGGASQWATLNPLKPQGPSCPEQPAAIRCDCKLGRCFGQPVQSPCCNPGCPNSRRR